nr:ribonuclease H-like domain-containing protein [Tanacetum cinerariifolium]
NTVRATHVNNARLKVNNARPKAVLNAVQGNHVNAVKALAVSQMCDKKNRVLFTDTTCVVLSSAFKLTDESHVLLKVPRKDNMYNIDLKNGVPQGGLTCLFAKVTSEESNLWH